MRSVVVKIENKEGLHARPASMIMQCASEFDSSVYLVVHQERVNAKSIMSLIGVSALYGSEVTLEIDGEDEAQAEEALKAVFASKFGEE
ncbi:HPr family phosphocarrier protein [Entomospira culicis]|uniref:HPr family phosphocarrier protein n=1 Tax=Entomospira culicis TaxID=2719989 RepID=A0A968KUM5_9SPIO|nr:HPr family phosphocarrier protein [Entomospira culicis]NIZ19371.1 HPr family phosphocarrier protein [Entomospira culicis]NIZ69724.1 HPr family phosphocarrier protein [Entomospira culicis]WDI36835.1 HPr family phosphocarrier protein [Entomospira culicis]WDI38464.1 HPr family phosphocarrier protein [Entomospira culicis]